MTKYISATETCKIIRQTLKAEFPTIKFSVRQSGGGYSARIEYTGELAPVKVEKLLGVFRGASFDGMQDLETLVYSTNANGELVHYGTKYIYVTRNISSEEESKFKAHFNYCHFEYEQMREVRNRLHLFDNYADFLAHEAEEARLSEEYYQMRLEENAKEESLQAAIDAVVTPLFEELQAPVVTESLVQDDYIAMLVAAGWIDAESVAVEPAKETPFRMVSIKVLWSESPDFVDNETFTAFAAFNQKCRLVSQAHMQEYGTSGCYHKTKFIVTFSDGDSYEGRADLNYQELGFDLVDRMIKFIEWRLQSENEAYLSIEAKVTKQSIEERKAELQANLLKYEPLRNQA